LADKSTEDGGRGQRTEDGVRPYNRQSDLFVPKYQPNPG
jgi:hypothetical protein